MDSRFKAASGVGGGRPRHKSTAVWGLYWGRLVFGNSHLGVGPLGAGITTWGAFEGSSGEALRALVPKATEGMVPKPEAFNVGYIKFAGVVTGRPIHMLAAGNKHPPCCFQVGDASTSGHFMSIK